MPVPRYVFDKTWLEGNFLIPADKGVRVELRQRLEQHSRMGIIFRSENGGTRTTLLARLAAIEAYDKVILKVC